MSHKLTDADIIDIMLDKKSTLKEMASRYGISPTHVSNIRHGRKYKHITLDPQYSQQSFIRKPQKKLTDASVIDILTDTSSTAKELAERHGVARMQIYDIHNGKIWKKVSCNYKLRTFEQAKKLNINIVTAIKNGEITDYEAVSKEYGVTVKHLKKLRQPNYIDCWKTIPIKK